MARRGLSGYWTADFSPLERSGFSSGLKIRGPVHRSFFAAFPGKSRALNGCQPAPDSEDWENLTFAVAAGLLGRQEIAATLRKLPG